MATESGAGFQQQSHKCWIPLERFALLGFEHFKIELRLS